MSKKEMILQIRQQTQKAKVKKRPAGLSKPMEFQMRIKTDGTEAGAQEFRMEYVTSILEY